MLDTTTEFDLYSSGRDYNNKLVPPYYLTVDRNYRYYGTDHWKGVKANGNPTPIFPITKQIIDYKISSIVSSKTAMQFSIENIPDDSTDPGDVKLQKAADLISGYSETKWEKLKMNSLIREVLLKGAVTGDMCLYTYWDKDIESGSTNGVESTSNTDSLPTEPTEQTPQEPQQEGQPNTSNLDNSPLQETPQPQVSTKPVKVMGDFVTEVISGANVMFGNPNDNRVQVQPYILISNRDLVENLKAKAKANKISKDEIDKIEGDSETNEQPGERGKIEIDDTKCLYLIKLWKEDKKVMMSISTRSAIIQKATDTGLTLYPIAWANWDRIENSYHGQADVTGLVDNQILINQMAANIAIYMKGTAFGKVVYDKTKIAGWDNRVTGAIGVEGMVTGAVQQIQPGQMNTMVMTFLEFVVNSTKDIAGANASALGNVNPNNTSAIMANQKQASVPLEAIRERLYQLVEDLGYIWLDFIVNKYSVDRKVSYKIKDKTNVGNLNGSEFKDVPFKLKVDVGASAYWSEIASMQTLGVLLDKQKITFIQYLQRMPSGTIPKSKELIAEITKQNQQMQQMQQAQQQQQQGQGQQAQQMQQQTQQLQDAHRQLDYGDLKQFFNTLSPDVQKKLQSLPDSQMEQATQQLMDLQKQGKLQAPQQQQPQQTSSTT